MVSYKALNTVTKLKTYAKQMRNAHYLIINEK